jgi:hypothetical protein
MDRIDDPDVFESVDELIDDRERFVFSEGPLKSAPSASSMTIARSSTL